MAAGPARVTDRAFRERRHRRRTPLSRPRLARIVAVVAAATAASTGCGKDDQERAVPIMTCNLEASAECDEIIGGMGLMHLSEAEFHCTQRGGSYSFTTRCPTTAVVGTCSIANIYYSGATLIERYYPPTDPATAKASCEQRNGVWASNERTAKSSTSAGRCTARRGPALGQGRTEANRGSRADGHEC